MIQLNFRNLRKIKAKKILLLLIIYLVIISCSSFGQSNDKRMDVFYKYDSLYFMGDKSKYLSVEIGDPNLIISAEKLSKNYRASVIEILESMNSFVNQNLNIILKYNECYNSFMKKNDKPFTRNEFDLVHEELIKLLSENLIKANDFVVRCMFAINSIQYIEVAKRLSNGQPAKTLFSMETDTVYWMNVLEGQYPFGDLKKRHTDEQGLIKYDHWFYESNLKIRIVKQIRDKNNKYLGEIYVDYYKLDKYEELFDENGKPKNKKKE
jgi:hypothetical protein